MIPNLYVLIGLPGSGKSTYAETLMEKHPDALYLSSDKIREELYGDESIQGNPQEVFGNLHHKMRKALGNNIDVIYDATNLSRKNRKKAVEIAKSANPTTIVHYIIIDTSLDECVRRNANRERKVPENVIVRMSEQFNFPQSDEGFSDIEIIK